MKREERRKFVSFGSIRRKFAGNGTFKDTNPSIYTKMHVCMYVPA
jgi:hypothetical protein